jgi:hypothetical protein
VMFANQSLRKWNRHYKNIEIVLISLSKKWFLK